MFFWLRSKGAALSGALIFYVCQSTGFQAFESKVVGCFLLLTGDERIFILHINIHLSDQKDKSWKN